MDNDLNSTLSGQGFALTAFFYRDISCHWCLKRDHHSPSRQAQWCPSPATYLATPGSCRPSPQLFGSYGSHSQRPPSCGLSSALMFLTTSRNCSPISHGPAPRWAGVPSSFTVWATREVWHGGWLLGSSRSCFQI